MPVISHRCWRLGDGNEGHAIAVEPLDQLGKVHQPAGQAVDLADYDHACQPFLGGFAGGDGAAPLADDEFVPAVLRWFSARKRPSRSASSRWSPKKGRRRNFCCGAPLRNSPADAKERWRHGDGTKHGPAPFFSAPEVAFASEVKPYILPQIAAWASRQPFWG